MATQVKEHESTIVYHVIDIGFDADIIHYMHALVWTKLTESTSYNIYPSSFNGRPITPGDPIDIGSFTATETLPHSVSKLISYDGLEMIISYKKSFDYHPDHDKTVGGLPGVHVLPFRSSVYNTWGTDFLKLEIARFHHIDELNRHMTVSSPPVRWLPVLHNFNVWGPQPTRPSIETIDSATWTASEAIFTPYVIREHDESDTSRP